MIIGILGSSLLQIETTLHNLTARISITLDKPGNFLLVGAAGSRARSYLLVKWFDSCANVLIEGFLI